MVACLPECRTRLCKRRARRHAPSPDHPGGEDECVCVCVCVRVRVRMRGSGLF